MVTEEVLIASTEAANDLVLELGKFGRWFQAFGLLAVMWIVMQILDFILNRRRLKEIKGVREDLMRVEEKVDKLGKKKK